MYKFEKLRLEISLYRIETAEENAKEHVIFIHTSNINIFFKAFEMKFKNILHQKEGKHINYDRDLIFSS